MSADVITLFPDATVQPLVPRPFGQRKPGYLAGGFAEVLDCARGQEAVDAAIDATPAVERRQREEAARRALKAEIATEIGVVAKMCAGLAEACKREGELRACVSLQEMQGIAETLAAEVSPYPPEMPA